MSVTDLRGEVEEDICVLTRLQVVRLLQEMEDVVQDADTFRVNAGWAEWDRFDLPVYHELKKMMGDDWADRAGES